MRLGEYLVHEEKISPTEANDALEIQKKFKKKLGRLLVELGFLDAQELNQVLVNFFNAKKEDVFQIKEMITGNQKAPSFLNNIAQKHKAFIISFTEKKIIFAKADFFDDSLIKKIEAQTGIQTLCWVVNQDEFRFLAQNEMTYNGQAQITVSRNLSDDEKLNESSPYAKLFKESLVKAKELNASDIHIEPSLNGVSVRFRIFGVLNTFKTLEKEHREGLVSKIKSIVSMDLAIVGRPQDSRASFKSLSLDIRANSLPNMYGEKIVLRLLDQTRDFSLENTGLSSSSIEILRQTSKRKDGLILISGPTGSGKTTTLYSLLFELPRDKLNVSTLESPVEYQLEGINQINIKDDGVNTFEGSLRALMRQDPDVILVGEIRDQETAKLAFKAASTGHLVFSTVHANGAKEVVERLQNFGIDTFTIKNNLRLSAAQRLIPTLCPKCFQKVDTNEVSNLKQYFDIKALKKSNPKGCQDCTKGISGRSAVLELMNQNEVIDFLDSKTELSTLPKQSLKAEIFKLIQLGKVDYKEAFAYI